MKKTVFLMILVTFFILTGCSAAADDKDGINIITTVFPTFDFARNIAPDANVTMLLPAGTESHSYEPSAQDIIRISECDLFIYIGGESESWVEKILNSLDSEINTLKLIDCVQTLENEDVHGEEEHEEEEEHEHEYDEHLWTSIKNSVILCDSIYHALSSADPENKASYQKNHDAYAGKLNSLDAEFTEFFNSTENKTLIFGDRFPLLYFVKSYGLQYYAAFPSCSGESEPSSATIAFLIEKIKSEQIGTVFYIEFSNHLIADSIAEDTGAKTALFHSCHNVTSKELANGVSYISLMEQNLATLKEALK